MRKAIGYAVGAVRLLYGHPSLALVALAMGVLWQVDARVGNYIARQHTGWGRDHRLWAEAKPKLGPDDPQVKRLRDAQGRFTRLARLSGWAMLTPPRTPELDLTGTILVLKALAYGPGGRPATGKQPPYLVHDGVAAPIELLLSWLIGSITAAGYLCVAWRAATTGHTRWRESLAPGWSVWWRVGLFNSIVLWVPMAAFTSASFCAPFVIPAVVLIYAWMALSFMLVLTPFAVVSLHIGIVRGARLSRRVVATNLPTALVLVLPTAALSGLVFRFSPIGRVSELLMQSGDAKVIERQLQSLAGLPLDAAAAGIAGIILAWYVAAMMLWCRDACPPPTLETPESPALC